MNNKILIISLLFFQTIIFGQNKVNGSVNTATNKPLKNVQVYNEMGGLLAETNALGEFKFITEKTKLPLIFYAEGYKIKNVFVELNKFQNLKIVLNIFQKIYQKFKLKQEKKEFSN